VIATATAARLLAYDALRERGFGRCEAAHLAGVGKKAARDRDRPLEMSSGGQKEREDQ